MKTVKMQFGTDILETQKKNYITKNSSNAQAHNMLLNRSDNQKNTKTQNITTEKTFFASHHTQLKNTQIKFLEPMETNATSRKKLQTELSNTLTSPRIREFQLGSETSARKSSHVPNRRLTAELKSQLFPEIVHVVTQESTTQKFGKTERKISDTDRSRDQAGLDDFEAEKLNHLEMGENLSIRSKKNQRTKFSDIRKGTSFEGCTKTSSQLSARNSEAENMEMLVRGRNISHHGIQNQSYDIFKNFTKYNANLISRAKLALIRILTPECLWSLASMDPSSLKEVQKKIEESLTTFVKSEIYLHSELMILEGTSEAGNKIDFSSMPNKTYFTENFKFNIRDLKLDTSKIF